MDIPSFHKFKCKTFINFIVVKSEYIYKCVCMQNISCDWGLSRTAPIIPTRCSCNKFAKKIMG